MISSQCGNNVALLAHGSTTTVRRGDEGRLKSILYKLDVGLISDIC